MSPLEEKSYDYYSKEFLISLLVNKYAFPTEEADKIRYLDYPVVELLTAKLARENDNPDNREIVNFIRNTHAIADYVTQKTNDIILYMDQLSFEHSPFWEKTEPKNWKKIATKCLIRCNNRYMAIATFICTVLTMILLSIMFAKITKFL